MKTLQAYIDQKNRWNAIFNGKQYEFQSKFGRQEIAGMLDADLSPENLTCDGEVRGEALRQKSAYLFRCVEELINLDPNVKFSELSI